MTCRICNCLREFIKAMQTAFSLLVQCIGGGNRDQTYQVTLGSNVAPNGVGFLRGTFGSLDRQVIPGNENLRWEIIRGDINSYDFQVSISTVDGSPITGVVGQDFWTSVVVEEGDGVTTRTYNSASADLFLLSDRNGTLDAAAWFFGVGAANPPWVFGTDETETHPVTFSF
jgi:hypothetical protein